MSSTSIQAIFPNLDANLWSRKALNTITSALGKLVGALRLGKPHDFPSSMVGVIVQRHFSFLEKKSINVVDNISKTSERVVRIYSLTL